MDGCLDDGEPAMAPASTGSDRRSPERELSALESTADRIETPCGTGAMVWRFWTSPRDGARRRPVLVLLHGGYGSWAHWVKAITLLAPDHDVLAPDMPGFGQSAMPPKPYDADSLGSILCDGLQQILDTRPCIPIGFSFGGILAGQLAMRYAGAVRRLVLVGTGGLGAPRPEMPDLVRRSAKMSRDDVVAAHRRNLEILMMADAAAIDPLALHIQQWNTAHARVKSRPISATPALAAVLPHVKAPLTGIWGAQDATAGPYLEDRRQVLARFDPDLLFHVIPNAGHWVMYEAPETFVRTLDRSIASESSG